MDYTTMPSPVGTLTLFATAKGLAGIYFPSHRRGRGPGPGDRFEEGGAGRPEGNPHLARASRELREYFAGQRTQFTVPLDPAGTPFQLDVWRELAQVRFGEKTTYGKLAAALGKAPGAARAVGAAVGRNPISIIVPCHRVIGQDGTLTGYAGGLEAKRWLLAHERALP